MDALAAHDGRPGWPRPPMPPAPPVPPAPPMIVGPHGPGGAFVPHGPFWEERAVPRDRTRELMSGRTAAAASRAGCDEPATRPTKAYAGSCWTTSATAPSPWNQAYSLVRVLDQRRTGGVPQCGAGPTGARRAADQLPAQGVPQHQRPAARRTAGPGVLIKVGRCVGERRHRTLQDQQRIGRHQRRAGPRPGGHRLGSRLGGTGRRDRQPGCPPAPATSRSAKPIAR